MNNGFSLLEALFTLMMIGLLIIITYPNYHRYITHARRIEGQLALIDLANRMEKYYLEKGTYETATIASQKVTDIIGHALTPGNWYLLSIVEATKKNYQLQAKAMGQQALNDSQCNTLTLNSAGTKESKNYLFQQSYACW